MRRIATFVVPAFTCAVFATLAAGAASVEKPAEKRAVKPPANRVVVMYFHRTQRCPTCLKMGSYSEEAVKKGFVKEVKDRTVEFHYIDFQDKMNASLTKAYRVTSPALMVAKVEKNKVVKVNDLREIWTKVRDKKAFLKYVQSSVTSLQKPLPKTAAKPPTTR